MLTADEHDAIQLAGQLYDLIVTSVIGHTASRDSDIAELAMHVHGIQHAVMANAAARAYPDEYRLLGGMVR